MVNPLLLLDGVPNFGAIEPSCIVHAVDALLVRARSALALAGGPTVPVDYEAVSSALHDDVERLSFAWSIVCHLQAVADSPELRTQFRSCLPKVAAFYAMLGGHPGLNRKYRAISSSPTRPQIADAAWTALQRARLSGPEVDRTGRHRVHAISERRLALSQRFTTNLIDATKRYAYHADVSEVEGIPACVLAPARAAALAEEKDGYRLGLQFPMYWSVMVNATNRRLRKTLYDGYTACAGEFGPHELDNAQLARELRQLGHEHLYLTGTDLRAQTPSTRRFSSDPDQSIPDLYNMVRSAQVLARQEIRELKVFANKALGLARLEAWDTPFASERLRQARYGVSREDVKKYFGVDRVLDGLMTLSQRLFDVTIVRVNLSTWHDSVLAYRVYRVGRELGVFYLDLYARENKRPGTAVNGLRSTRRQGSDTCIAVSCVICNFASSCDDATALAHDALVTLFHEFGNNMFFLLAPCAEIEQAALESKVRQLQDSAWTWEVLEGVSAHIDSGARLPRSIFQKLSAARGFQAGVSTLRHIEYALLDVTLHAHPGTGNDVDALLDLVRADMTMFPATRYDPFSDRFSLGFPGDWTAGYYSPHWTNALTRNIVRSTCPP
jgi:oligopeptidase A